MLIFSLIIGCIVTIGGYFYYIKFIKDNSLVIVDENLTINYKNGHSFSKYRNKQLKFTVTNNSDEVAYYYISLKDIKGKNKTVTYELRTKDKTIKVSDDLKGEIIYNSIAIDPNKTDTYVICFKTITNENYKGNVLVKSKLKDDIIFADIILKNNRVNEKTLSTIGESATLDEGLQKSKDSLGSTYYFRGDVRDNYVLFANYLWRIVRINGDNSVKLVLNEALDVLNKYYEDNYEYLASLINKRLQNWYQENLAKYSDFIANHKYCNDMVKDTASAKFIAYDRIVINKIPTFVCLGKEYNLKIGLLTADEVMLAGGSSKANKKYYLYNEKITSDFYTMTGAKNDNNLFKPFVVKKDGSLGLDTAGNLNRNVRPVINIIHNVTASGDGTLTNPYQIEITNNNNK